MFFAAFGVSGSVRTIFPSARIYFPVLAGSALADYLDRQDERHGLTGGFIGCALLLCFSVLLIPVAAFFWAWLSAATLKYYLTRPLPSLPLAFHLRFPTISNQAENIRQELRGNRISGRSLYKDKTDHDIWFEWPGDNPCKMYKGFHRNTCASAAGFSFSSSYPLPTKAAS